MSIDTIIKEMRECTAVLIEQGASLMFADVLQTFADRLDAEARKGAEPVAWVVFYGSTIQHPVRYSRQDAESDMATYGREYHDGKLHVRALFAAPQPAIPEGWQLVPVEPNTTMIVAGTAITKKDGWSCTVGNGVDLVYRAMLAAAPKPPAGEGDAK